MAYVAVVGSRSVSSLVPAQVRSVVASLVVRGYGIGSGGALGADQCALVSLLSVATPTVLAQSRLCLAWVCHSSLPASVRGSVVRFTALGGQGIPGWAGCAVPFGSYSTSGAFSAPGGASALPRRGCFLWSRPLSGYVVHGPSGTGSSPSGVRGGRASSPSSCRGALGSGHNRWGCWGVAVGSGLPP